MSTVDVQIHPDVRKYLDELEASETERCKESLEQLADDPFRSRPNCDIKKLKGTQRTLYRLRVGDHRFEYFVEDNTIWIVESFRRGRGYR